MGLHATDHLSYRVILATILATLATTPLVGRSSDRNDASPATTVLWVAQADDPKQPVLVEPPGGPIVWGLTYAQTTVPLDGRDHVLLHAQGYGMALAFAASRCNGGRLEVTRAGAPLRAAGGRMPGGLARGYVPDGSYVMVPICEGVRGALTRIEIARR